jgi:hypothetical protein
MVLHSDSVELKVLILAISGKLCMKDETRSDIEIKLHHLEIPR